MAFLVSGTALLLDKLSEAAWLNRFRTYGSASFVPPVTYPNSSKYVCPATVPSSSRDAGLLSASSTSACCFIRRRAMFSSCNNWKQKTLVMLCRCKKIQWPNRTVKNQLTEFLERNKNYNMPDNHTNHLISKLGNSMCFEKTETRSNSEKFPTRSYREMLSTRTPRSSRNWLIKIQT